MSERDRRKVRKELCELKEYFPVPGATIELQEFIDTLQEWQDNHSDEDPYLAVEGSYEESAIGIYINTDESDHVYNSRMKKLDAKNNKAKAKRHIEYLKLKKEFETDD
jgi:hypothetical protein